MTMDFSLFDNPAIAGNPFPMFATMRQNAPVMKPPGAPMWMVTRYEDVLRILRDPATFSSQVAATPTDGSKRPTTILFDDPPIHTRMRGLLTSAFTPRVVELQRDSIQEYCTKLVDNMCAKETADWVAEIAYPLPVMVIANMLGVQDGDMATFKRWSDAIIENVANALFEPETNALDEINREFDAYFKDRLDKVRRQPEDNLLTALVHAESPEDGKLSEGDLLVICRVLLVAGNETTTGLIVNSARVFEEFPEMMAEVKANPNLTPAAIEETLRMYPTFPATFRITTRDVDVHGVTIPKGERVLALIASANHDEEVFERPEEFIIDRTSNRHLAFGMGIHYCLGAPLARLEADIAWRTLLPRIRSLKIEGDGAGSVLNPGGPKALPVRFELERATAPVA